MAVLIIHFDHKKLMLFLKAGAVKRFRVETSLIAPHPGRASGPLHYPHRACWASFRTFFFTVLKIIHYIIYLSSLLLIFPPPPPTGTIT